MKKKKGDIIINVVTVAVTATAEEEQGKGTYALLALWVAPSHLHPKCVAWGRSLGSDECELWCG